MLSRIFQFLQALFGSGVARFLTGAGLGIASYAALSAVVLTALHAVVAAFSGLLPGLAQLTLLGGFANQLNLVASAILTRLALDSGALSIRKKP